MPATAALPRVYMYLRRAFSPNSPARFLGGLAKPPLVTLLCGDRGGGIRPTAVQPSHDVCDDGVELWMGYHDSLDQSANDAPFLFSGTIHEVVFNLTIVLSINPRPN